MNLEQLRKQAKDRVRERRRAGEQLALGQAQLELAREHGFPSWPKLKAHVERFEREQPFRTDLAYYDGRAEGIATTAGVTLDEARLDLARRHGFRSWAGLRRHVSRLRSGAEPPTPFVLAYRAVEAGDRDGLAELLDRVPELVRQRGTNGNDLLGMAEDLELVRLLLERGGDPNRGNDYGWTKLHQAGYSNRRELAELLLSAGARTDLSARGDGGTPLIAALFWGHRRVVDVLGREPGNLRVAAGLGDLEADPYRGTPLAWAAANGRAASIRKLVELGADPNQRGTFGGPTHGEGVTAVHLAAQAGRREAVWTLLELGADPELRDDLYDGNAIGWARAGGHQELAEALRALD